MTVGRPTKFKEEYIETAYKLALLGMTDAQMADFFEVDESTINNWKHAYPEFFKSLKKGKEIADIEVVEALRKRALGYKYDEVKVEDDSKVTVTTKEVAPDTTAQIFWLKNRQPHLWRDKQEIDNISSDGSTVTKIERVIIDPKQ